MSNPTDNVSRLATIAKMMEDGNWHSSAKVVLAAADEIERLRKERDEARREICRMVFASGGIRPAEYAKTIGWDCFKGEQ